MTTPIRLSVAMTHPIQYYSPWFRFIESDVPEIELSVLYAAEPTPEQQGAQFGERFSWDIPLRDGYSSRVLSEPSAGSDFGSDSFWGVDVPAMSSVIETSRPDVVLSSGWHSVTLMRVMRMCRRSGIPLLYRGDTHLMTGPTRGRSSGSYGWLRRARTRWLLGHFDRYLSVGIRVREFLAKLGIPGERVYDAPHAVDNDFFERQSAPYRHGTGRTDARAALGLAPDDFVMLFAGKLEPHKRPSDLIRAAALLEPPGVVLMVGSGSSKNACRELAAELDVELRLPGFLNQSELGKAYAVSDCLVVPSIETWGLVVNEAMATGLPAVVSDRVGAAPDLVHAGRTGETFPWGGVDALARAIERVRSSGDRSASCRDQLRGYSFESASEGLLAACVSAATHSTISA